MNPSDKKLFKGLVRVAHENPDLRQKLLPVLKKHRPQQRPQQRVALDTAAVRELELYIPNEFDLYKQIQAAHTNLQRKLSRGVYDFEKSVKLFEYVVAAGAKKYVKDFGGDVRSTFPKAVRTQVARGLAEEFREEFVV
jgi:DNA mismatch repair ATPase MutS